MRYNCMQDGSHNWSLGFEIIYLCNKEPAGLPAYTLADLRADVVVPAQVDLSAQSATKAGPIIRDVWFASAPHVVSRTTK